MYDNTIAQKIAKQYNLQPLTDFASVKPETALETLNLNWRESDLPEYQRTKHVHRLHPYLGKFIPQLVEIFLRKYKPTLVYDPFAGSGTTLVEANALGIDSVGTDISIFNVLLSKVKTADYDISLLEKEICDILKRLDTYKSKFSKDEKVNKLFSTKNEYIQEWFAPNTQKELLCYSRLIKDYTYQDLLRIILSRSARSARLVTHYDLDFPKEPQTKPYQCYKHQRTCQPVEEAYKFLSRYTIDTLDRVKEFSKIKLGTLSKLEVIMVVIPLNPVKIGLLKQLIVLKEQVDVHSNTPSLYPCVEQVFPFKLVKSHCSPESIFPFPHKGFRIQGVVS